MPHRSKLFLHLEKVLTIEIGLIIQHNHNGDRHFQQDDSKAKEKSSNYENINMH